MAIAASVGSVDRHKDSGAIPVLAHCAFNRLDNAVERWAAIRTSARWEKKTAQCLSSIGISVFLPTLTKITQYKTRKNTAEVPLFSGYLFFDETRLHELAKIAPAAQKYIAQVLKPPDYGVLRAELCSIARLLQDNRLVQARVYGKPGETVRITRGSFKDLEGKIRRQIPGSSRFVLAVSFLGLAVEVEVGSYAIQKVY